MKKVFLNISKYSQKNACVGVSFLFFFQDYYVETPTQVFSCEYFEILRTAFYIELLWWLILKIQPDLKNLELRHFSPAYLQNQITLLEL